MSCSCDALLNPTMAPPQIWPVDMTKAASAAGYTIKLPKGWPFVMRGSNTTMKVQFAGQVAQPTSAGESFPPPPDGDIVIFSTDTAGTITVEAWHPTLIGFRMMAAAALAAAGSSGRVQALNDKNSIGNVTEGAFHVGGKQRQLTVLGTYSLGATITVQYSHNGTDWNDGPSTVISAGQTFVFDLITSTPWVAVKASLGVGNFHYVAYSWS